MPSEKPMRILRATSQLTAAEIDAMTEAEGWQWVYSHASPRKEKLPAICFTGFSPSEKAELSQLATGAGLRVVTGVSLASRAGASFVHQLRRERAPARRLPAAGLVCSRREPAARVLRRHMDPLDIGAEGQGARDDQRPVRLPDDGAERDCRADSRQGDAGHLDDRRGSRPLDDGDTERGAFASATFA